MLTILLALQLQVLADYNNYTLKDFANVVASQNHINIVIDEALDQKFDFVITKPIKAYTNLNVFMQLLKKYGLELQNRSTYYIIIRKEDQSIDKIKIYHTNHIDAQKASIKIIPILASFYKEKQQPNIKQNKSPSENKPNKLVQIPTAAKDNNSTQKAKYKDFSLNALDHKTLVLTYKDDKIQRYANMIIASMDHIKKQLSIQCKVYEVKTSALEKKGIQMEAIGETVNKAFNLRLQLAGAMPTIIDSSTDRLRVNTLISLLQDNTDSTLLATPKITLLEGRKGKLKEGSTYPITTQQTTTTNASTSNTVQKTKYIDIGLIFALEYEYEQDNYNYLKIQLNKKDLLSYDREKQTIITTTRDISTDIRIVEGETIIIAGVGRNTIEKKQVAVPYLSQIPLLGELLKYKYKEDKKTTLVITIRVKSDATKRALMKKVR